MIVGDYTFGVVTSGVPLPENFNNKVSLQEKLYDDSSGIISSSLNLLNFDWTLLYFFISLGSITFLFSSILSSTSWSIFNSFQSFAPFYFSYFACFKDFLAFERERDFATP